MQEVHGNEIIRLSINIIYTLIALSLGTKTLNGCMQFYDITKASILKAFCCCLYKREIKDHQGMYEDDNT